MHLLTVQKCSTAPSRCQANIPSAVLFTWDTVPPRESRSNPTFQLLVSSHHAPCYNAVTNDDCGDLEVLGVLDHLETIAPVKAVRGHKDPTEPGDRLAERTRVVEVEGISIGMVHDLGWPGPVIHYYDTLEFPPGPVQDILKRKFGKPVDVVCFGDVHEEFIDWYQWVLFVNSSSPTHPGLRHTYGDLGTLAYLNIKNGVISAELKKLQRDPKFTSIPALAPLHHLSP